MSDHKGPMSRGRKLWLGETTLRTIAVTAVLSLLAACAGHAPAPRADIASVESNLVDPKNGDGIGGTGIRTAQTTPARGDGIGGTGIRGTITGFGSILVNGLKLDFDHTTTVETDGKPTTLEALRVGQIVQGVARSKDGKLSLARLEIQHAVAGAISAIDHDGQTLTVMGQKVRLNLGGDKSDIAAFRTLQAGDIVSVSGLRQTDGVIIATRVDQTAHDDRIILRGPASAVTASSLRIGDVDVALPPGATTPKAGDHVVAAGRTINGVFMPESVSASSPLEFGADVSSVSLEAYAPKAAGNAGPLVIDGVDIGGVALPAGTNINDRIVVTGQVLGPNSITATSINSVRTVVTINAARGTLRPATVRPDNSRPERVAPRPNIERPQAVRPDPPVSRPTIERPQGVPMV